MRNLYSTCFIFSLHHSCFFFIDEITTSLPYRDANLNCKLGILVCKRNRKAHDCSCAHLDNTHHIRRRTRSSRKRETTRFFFQATLFSVAALFSFARLFNLVTGLSQLPICSSETDKDIYFRVVKQMI